MQTSITHKIQDLKPATTRKMILIQGEAAVGKAMLLCCEVADPPKVVNKILTEILTQ